MRYMIGYTTSIYNRSWRSYTGGMAEGERTVNLFIEMPEGVHGKLRTLAALEGKTMKQWLIDRIVESPDPPVILPPRRAKAKAQGGE